MEIPNPMTDVSDDPDDIETLRDDTRRSNDQLSQRVRHGQAVKAALRREASADEQEFHDALSVERPQSFSDVEADAREELTELERLDVFEGLRALQTGDPISWKIYRVGAQDHELNGYLDTWSTSQLDQGRLRDEFGGGTYRIRGQDSRGRFAGGRTVHVAGDAKRREKSMTSATGGVAGGFNLAEFLSQQEARDASRRQEQIDERKREKEERERQDERSRQNRNEMLALVLPAVTGLTTALVGAFSANRGPDIASLIVAMKGPDPITVLTQLKQLQGNNDGALTKILPMLIDMAGTRASGGDTGWLDIVKELAKSAGPTIGGMIEMSVQTARANVEAAGRPALPAPSAPNPTLPSPPGLIVVPESHRPRLAPTAAVNGAPGAGSAGSFATPAGGPAAATATTGLAGTTPAGADMNYLALLPHLPWLKAMLVKLGKAAQSGKNHQVYAALFVEELPDTLDVNQVGQLLSASDWYQKLCQVEPRLDHADFLPWFTALRDEVLRLLRPAGEGQPQPVPAPSASPKPKPQAVEVERPTRVPSLDGSD